MNITSQQVKELKIYNINAKEINDIDIILDKLSSYMINNCFYTGGNPKDILFEVEKLYDELVYQNPLEENNNEL